MKKCALFVFIILLIAFPWLVPITQAQDRLVTNLTDLATQAFSGWHSIYLPFTAWEWQGYSTDGGEPWWIDCSRWPCLDLSPASTNINGVALFAVRLTKNVLTGEITYQSNNATDVLARIEAPSDYQPGARVEDRGVWYMWQQATNCPDCWGIEGDIPPPTVTLRIFLADAQDKPTWDEAVAAQEAAWEEAQAEAARLQAEMFPSQEDSESAMLMDSGPCSITNETQPFIILSIASSTNGVTLTWESCSDHVYGVFSADQLTTGTIWVGRTSMWGLDGDTSWTDTTTSSVTNRFYKVIRMPPDEDFDGDGMPNGWEINKEFNPLDYSDATADADGDGYNNLEEYLNGTDPHATNTLIGFVINNGNLYTASLSFPIQPLNTNYPKFLAAYDGLSNNVTLYTNTGGSVTYALPDEGDGVYGVYAQYADGDGNPGSPMVVQSVTLDRQGPVVLITAPASNAVLDQAFITLKATAYDPGAIQPNTTAPLSIWINGQPFWDRTGTNIVIERFSVPSGTNLLTVTIRAADQAGHTNEASRTWTVDPSSDVAAPQFTNFNMTTSMLLPDVGQVWVEASLNDSNAMVSATVSPDTGEVTTNSLHVRGTHVEGLLPLGFGTNTVILSARDAAGNMTSNAFSLIRSGHFSATITNPAFGTFVAAASNTVSGYVSALFDTGLPTQTNITSVLINGVPAILGTNVDDYGNVSFRTTNAIPLDVPITGTIGGPGIPTDPPPTIPPAQSPEYEVTYKETGFENVYGGESGILELLRGSGTICWSGNPQRQLNTQRLTASIAGTHSESISEFDGPPACLTVLNPDLITWHATYVSPVSSYNLIDPINRSLSFGLRSYVHGEGRDVAVVLDTYDPGTGTCTFKSSLSDLRVMSRLRDIGWLKFRAPRHYDTNVTVILTFEGMDYKRRYNTPLDLSQVKFRGQDPFAYSNETETVSYLATVDGGAEYTLTEDDFDWPADQQPSHAATAYDRGPNGCPFVKSDWTVLNSITDMHRLSWTNFHNAKPQIDIVGLDQITKKDPGGLVVCNCDSNGPPRSQIIIQKMTNVNANVVLTIPSQVKVFTTSNNTTEVTSGVLFSNSKLPTNLWVEGQSVSTTMRDAKLSVAFEGVSNSSDNVAFTVLWVEMSSRTTGEASMDNAARDNYWVFAGGTYDLGPLNNGVQMIYGTELTGTVHPSGIQGTILLRRFYNSARTYLDGSQDTSPGTINNDGGVDDTSFSIYVDQDPQSNASQGKVYDLDAPALGLRQSLPVGSIRRNRFNFKEWAQYRNARCSTYYEWYVRQSIVKTEDPNTWARQNSVTGDNSISQGQTPISWDLQ